MDAHADILRMLRGDVTHLKIIASLVLDAADPKMAPAEQTQAIERIININPTVGLMVAIGLLHGADHAIGEALGQPAGQVIAGLRKEVPAELDVQAPARLAELRRKLNNP